MAGLFDFCTTASGDVEGVEFFAERDALHAKWEAARGRMRSKINVLEGITRFAAQHSPEFRNY